MQGISTAERSPPETSTATVATISRSGFRACPRPLATSLRRRGSRSSLRRTRRHSGRRRAPALSGPAGNIPDPPGGWTALGGHSRPATSMAMAFPTSRSERRSCISATTTGEGWSSCTAASAAFCPSSPTSSTRTIHRSRMAGRSRTTSAMPSRRGTSTAIPLPLRHLPAGRRSRDVGAGRGRHRRGHGHARQRVRPHLREQRLSRAGDLGGAVKRTIASA